MNTLNLIGGETLETTKDSQVWQRVGHIYRTHLVLRPEREAFTIFLPFLDLEVTEVRVNGVAILRGQVEFRPDGRLTIVSPWDGSLVVDITTRKAGT